MRTEHAAVGIVRHARSGSMPSTGWLVREGQLRLRDRRESVSDSTTRGGRCFMRARAGHAFFTSVEFK